MILKKKKTLNVKELYKIDGYFRAANYLSVGQLYLLDNPLLKKKLEIEHIKPRLVGHWGTVPGQNFIITHLNRIIKKNDLNMMLVVGPGHGGNAAISNCYLEGTYSKFYKDIEENEDGLKKLFKQFSFPGGVSSHVAPEIPGSINEGGELGYSLAHSFGSVLDNPDLIVACIIGDGEAETGPLATSFNLNKILNPKTDGIVLPILHLNGYKISNPTLLSRIPRSELRKYLQGMGWEPYFVDVGKLPEAHEKMASTLDEIILEIKNIKKIVRKSDNPSRPTYPILVFSSPKGWTGPKKINNLSVEGSFRAHQIPVTVDKITGEYLDLVENWLRSYRPEELFDINGKLKDEFKEFIPDSKHRLFSSKYANGGLLLKELKLPNHFEYATLYSRGNGKCQDMIELSKYLRDVIKLNRKTRNFRAFSPDEALSNRMAPIFEETDRQFNAIKTINDEFLNKDGFVVDSYLSEHVCEGLLEGYLLTGRHGLFDSYEAFARVVDSMLSQHAKWLKKCNEIEWRHDIASLNLLLTSHCWQQDHNGYTHQDPGILNHLVTKKADITRIYLPPDANTLISIFNHVLQTKNYINVVVASKHPSFQWLTMEEAENHCANGLGEWKWASTTKRGEEPELILCSAGDTPTLECLAASKLLSEYIPNIKLRFINVVDLMRLQSQDRHPHGLTEKKYNSLFTMDKPIIFAFHGYPSLIHELIYNRVNQNVHVHGYIEEGTITTPFDMRVQNRIDRYNLILSALKYLPQYGSEAQILKKYCNTMLKKHQKHIREYGVDMDEIANWTFK